MATSQSVVEGLALLFAMYFLAAEARFEVASRRGVVTVFHPVLFFRLGFGLAVPTLLYGTSQLIGTRDWFFAGIDFSMAFLIFANWPGTIVVDKNMIRETRWLGLKRTRILWSDVAYAGDDIESRVTVRSKNGPCISHTAYHSDRDAFIWALMQYCPICQYNQFPKAKPWVPLGTP